MKIYAKTSAIALALMLAACSNPLSDPLEDAHTAFEEQNYFLARDKVQEALRDDNTNLDALLLLAQTQIAMGIGEDVLNTLARMDRVGERPAGTNLLAAEAHLQLGDTEKMRAELGEEQSAEAYRLHALAFVVDGDEPSALAAFASGREAEGDKLRLYSAEASYHLGFGNAEAAREPVALAQEAGPARVETYFVTARLAQLDQDSETASRAFLAILDVAPLDRPALLGGIYELGNLGRVDLLRPLVERGREAYPQDPEFLFLAGRVLAEDGEWEAVRELFQTHETALADHPDSRGLYGQALLEVGQAELARSYLAPLYRLQRNNPQVVRTYARALIELGDGAKAREIMAPLANRPDAEPQDKELAARAAQV